MFDFVFYKQTYSQEFLSYLNKSVMMIHNFLILFFGMIKKTLSIINYLLHKTTYLLSIAFIFIRLLSESLTLSFSSQFTYIFLVVSPMSRVHNGRVHLSLFIFHKYPFYDDEDMKVKGRKSLKLNLCIPEPNNLHLLRWNIIITRHSQEKEQEKPIKRPH